VFTGSRIGGEPEGSTCAAPRPAGAFLACRGHTVVMVAFVLGGGGHLGAAEVGMLRALLERGTVPELVVGTSIGAINGAAVAADPTPGAAERLAAMWTSLERSDVFGRSVLGRVGTLARTRTHLHDNAGLRTLLAGTLGTARIEQLPVRFECVAASIESASERWFTSGPVVDAVLASSAVPGLLPPVAIDGEHFLDGGIVNSIPVGRAVDLGARTVYVMHVGRIDRPLEPPRWPWEVALVAFEIARRHRFLGDIAALPDDLEVHVLPTGQQELPRYSELSQFRYRDTSKIPEHIERAFQASSAYLDRLQSGAAPDRSGGEPE
jgi:NTE family protein